MKLGDIKAEALNLMSIVGYMGFDNTNIDTLYNDETAKSYLYGMTGSINRALTRLYSEGKLGYASVIVSNDELANGSFDSGKLTDCGKVERIFIVDEFGTERAINFISDDGCIKLRRFINPNLKYKIVYRKKAPFVAYSTPNSAELDIPQEAANIIPYFIKGELYADEEPSAAAAAMSIFEQYIHTLSNDGARQEYVEAVIHG